MPSLLLALVLATTGPLAVGWQAPPADCPAPAEVDARIRTLLGDRRLDLRADARVQAVPTGWEVRLRVHWRSHTDERVLSASDCRSLADATALLIAVMADPLEVSSQTAAATHGEPSVPPTPQPTTPQPTIPEPWLPPASAEPAPSSVPPVPSPVPRPPPVPDAARAPLDRGLALELGPTIDHGSLPGHVPGPMAGLVWRGPWLRLLASGLYLPPRGVVGPSPAAAEGRAQLAALRVGACLRLGGRRVEVPLCAIAEAGVAWGTRFGVDADRRALDPWSAIGAAAGVSLPLTPWLALSARVEGLGSLTRIRYVDGARLLHQAAPLVVRGTIGFEIPLPFRSSARVEND